jgi:hypothetical protein
MKKFTMLASASLLAISGSAFAEQALTDAQMDGVSAGAVVLLQGAALGGAFGTVISNTLGITETNTAAIADPTGALTGTPSSWSYADSTSVGLSVTDGATIGGALAVSESAAEAALF